MAEQFQDKKIKCPYCGYVRHWKLRVDGTTADIVMDGKVTDQLKELAKKIQEMWTDRELEAANAWIDMPECPNCDRAYQYNLRTGERR